MIDATSDTTFDADVLEAERPVIVHYSAEWCGPCRMFAPTLDAVAADAGDRYKVVTLDIDTSPMTPQRFNLRAVPTLMVFKGGQVVATKIGAIPADKLADWIDASI